MNGYSFYQSGLYFVPYKAAPVVDFAFFALGGVLGSSSIPGLSPSVLCSLVVLKLSLSLLLAISTYRIAGNFRGVIFSRILRLSQHSRNF